MGQALEEQAPQPVDLRESPNHPAMPPRGVRVSGYQSASDVQLAFDDCHEKYRACYEICFHARHLCAVDAAAFRGNSWKPDRKPRMEDFIADFARAGQEALEREGQHSQVVLFKLYYVSLAPYERVRLFLGLGEMGWVRWTENIRKVVGAELVLRGIYPARKYFEEFSR